MVKVVSLYFVLYVNYGQVFHRKGFLHILENYQIYKFDVFVCFLLQNKSTSPFIIESRKFKVPIITYENRIFNTFDSNVIQLIFLPLNL